MNDEILANIKESLVHQNQNSIKKLLFIVFQKLQMFVVNHAFQYFYLN
jgi:hypothetical protein